MSTPNAICKKHNETEPSDNNELWVCPGCSKETMKKASKPLPCGRKPLDVALADITFDYVKKKYGRKV